MGLRGGFRELVEDPHPAHEAHRGDRPEACQTFGAKGGGMVCEIAVEGLSTGEDVAGLDAGGLGRVRDLADAGFSGPAPAMALASQTEMTAPMGSAKMAIRPNSITSIGSMRTLPPLALALAAASSALSTVT